MWRKALPWVLLGLLVSFMLWLALAVVVTENTRYALFTQVCADPSKPGQTLAPCLAGIESRAHWWQHLGFAMAHVQP